MHLLRATHLETGHVHPPLDDARLHGGANQAKDATLLTAAAPGVQHVGEGPRKEETDGREGGELLDVVDSKPGTWETDGPEVGSRPPGRALLHEEHPTQKVMFFCFILLTHMWSHRKLYRKLLASYEISRRWCQGLFRTKVPCAPPTYTVQLLTLYQHRANNQYRTSNQI